MQYFHFERLLEKYKAEVQITVPKSGEYNFSGDWVESETEKITIIGAVINFKESKIYRSEGKLTAKDKRLFTQTPIEADLHGARAQFGDTFYSIEETTENARFTGVYSYLLKYTSSLGEEISNG